MEGEGGKRRKRDWDYTEIYGREYFLLMRTFFFRFYEYSAAVANPNAAAGYATLREIEGRLKSIRNIEKITNTMKIVASTKLTRATRSMTESRKYGQTANEVYESAETTVPEVDAEATKKSLIIVCSSDKGLCGGIHSGLSRRIRALFAEQGPSDLVIIGEKCKAQLSRSAPQSLQLSFSGIGKDIPTFADAQAIADQVIMLPTEYTDVKILYNKFVNAQTYEPEFIEAFSEEAFAASRKSISDRETPARLYVCVCASRC